MTVDKGFPDATKISFSIRELQAATGIGRTKIFGALADGSLKGRRMGAKVIIPAENARTWIENLPAAR